jgi:hypothetical protein
MVAGLEEEHRDIRQPFPQQVEDHDVFRLEATRKAGAPCAFAKQQIDDFVGVICL